MELIQDTNWDGLFIGLSVNFQYLTGLNAQPSERLIGLYLAPDIGFLLTPSFEVSRLENLVPSNITPIPWHETDNPVKLLYKTLEEHNLPVNTIGLEPKIWYETAHEFMKTFNTTTFHPATQFFDYLRSIKSPWEIKQLTNAATLSATLIDQAFHDIVQTGKTETQVANEIMALMTQHSNEPSWALVQFGANSAIPHHHSSNKKLQHGEVVLIDAGTSINGYQGDITITSINGPPTKDFLNIYEAVEQANQNAFEGISHGAPCHSIDTLARHYLKTKNLAQYFTHRLGHGIGLEIHEPPYLVQGNERILLEGNTHTVEPGVYVPNKFGIRIEDDVLVEGRNGKRLTNVPRRQWEA